ncbi:MAG: TraB family protein, partial [archaeon]
EIKQKDVMTQLMDHLSNEFPSIKEVLVDERDTYIANKIMQIDAKKIVAVVGAGHVEGIKKNIGKIADLSVLETVDTKKSNLLFLGYLIPVFFIVLLGYAFFVKGIGTTISFLALWIVVTGGLSALGVLLARGHPFSIITAFIAAPVTTLHPLLAAGWFAGYVEAKIKSPKVADFESLRNLNSFGDFTKNSVTKILLVVAFANIGATIGTLVAFPAIIAMIG